MDVPSTFTVCAAEKTNLRIVLLGKTGVGKSSAGNIILGRKAFESHPSFCSVTSVCEKKTDDFRDLNLDVIDTPGLFGTKKSNEKVVEEITRCISMAAPGPHVFLIVLQPTRFTEEDKETLKIIKKTFGEEAARYTMVLFTNGDELKKRNINIEDMLEKHQPLKHIISQCSILETFEDKYHVFDNNVEDSAEVSKLLQKIQRMVQQNGGSYYSKKMVKRDEPEEMERPFRSAVAVISQDVLHGFHSDCIGRLNRLKERSQGLTNTMDMKSRTTHNREINDHTSSQNEPESDLRVVLVGQERVGKSSAGNTILGRKEFNSELSLVPLTLSSKRAEGEVLSRRVSVVDTPGLCSSVLKPEEVKAEIQRAVELSSPGPHVFLLTMQLGRFTEQEKRGLEMLGPEVSKNIMILFTYGDRLEQTGINIDEFVQRDENLQKLVKSCSGMYHVFNNQKMEDRKQVQDLLDKIDSLRKRCYFPKIIDDIVGYFRRK